MFNVHNLVILVYLQLFSTFCNYHHSLIPEHFHRQKGTAYPFLPTSRPSLATTGLLSFSGDLPFLDIEPLSYSKLPGPESSYVLKYLQRQFQVSQ